MIDKDSTNNNSYVVNVKVLDIEKRYRPGPKYYAYIIQVTWSNPANTFIIYRRYAQFFDLQCKLLDLFAEAPTPSKNYKSQSRQIPFLPGKIFLGRSQIRQIALERKHALNIYCQTLIALPERISRSRPVLEFFQPLPTDVQNTNEFSPNNKKPITKNSVIISGPSKLPTYRCSADFVAIEKMEMSLKRNTLVQVEHKNLNGWWFVQNGDRSGFVPGAFLEPVEHEGNIRQTNLSRESSDETYVVNQSHQAANRDEISLDKGSFVTVLEKSFTGWWTVKFKNIAGQFPSVYLTSCKGRIIPEVVPNEVSNIRLSHSNNYEENDQNHSAPELFYVHSDFIDDVGDCVSLQRGDIVEIHDKNSSGWWLGRRVKDDYILTWIPSAFLQKEPIFDTYIERVRNSELYLNVASEDNGPRENIYQNIGNQMTTDVMYTEVLKKEQPIVRKYSNDNEQDSTNMSVRDLVKKFNRQQ